MVTIAKKLKISLTAIAFVLGIGAAFATSSTIQSHFADCSGLNPGENPNTHPTGNPICPLPDQKACCVFEDVQYYERN